MSDRYAIKPLGYQDTCLAVSGRGSTVVLARCTGDQATFLFSNRPAFDQYSIESVDDNGM